jgi:hypothetical protein
VQAPAAQQKALLTANVMDSQWLLDEALEGRPELPVVLAWLTVRPRFHALPSAPEPAHVRARASLCSRRAATWVAGRRRQA